MSAIQVCRVGRRMGAACALVAMAVVLTACGSTATPSSGAGGTSSAATSSAPATSESAPASSESSSESSSGSAEAGASSGQATAEATGGTLEGTNWLLIQANDATGVMVAADSSAGSTMSIIDGQLAVDTGCNTGGAEVAVEDDSLELGPMVMTMMACEDDLMKLEGLIAKVYDGTVSYAMTGDTLKVTGDAGVLVYRADGEAASDSGGSAAMSLQLDSLTDGDGKAVPLDGVESTLDIDGDQITFNTGCNTGGGQITLAGDTVTFGPMHLTMMACAGAAGDVEAALLKILDGSASFTIEGTELTVSNDAGTAVYTSAG